MAGRSRDGSVAGASSEIALPDAHRLAPFFIFARVIACPPLPIPMMRSCSLLLVAFALGLTACDSGDADEPLVTEPGRFSALVAIDGGDRISFGGLASATPTGLFVLDSVFVGDDSLRTLDTLRTAFMITLGEFASSGPGHLISFLLDGGQPAPGTYALGGFDRDGFFAFFSSLDGPAFPIGGAAFAAESGTLTLDVSTADRVAGRFEFRARSLALGEGSGSSRTATIRGVFDASIRGLGDLPPPEAPRP